MSFLKDYEKAKASGSSGSSGGKTIAQKRIDAELQKKYPEYSGIKNVLKKFTQDVDAGYIDSYINDINSYSMDVDWDNIGWGSAQQAYKNYAERIKDLRSRGGKILGYLDQNVADLDPDSYHMLKDQIIASQNSLAEQMGALNDVNQYYSQWDTEDAYNTAMQQRTWAEKYQGKSYQELAPILETLEDGDEKNWLTDYAGAVDYDERLNMDLNAANQEIQALQDQLNRARNLEENYNEYRNSPLLMLTQGDIWRDLESRYDALIEQYGSIEELEGTLNQKRQRMASAKQLQDSIQAEAELEEWKKTVRDSSTIQKDIDKLNKLLEMNEGAIRDYNRGSSQQDMNRRSEATAQKTALEQQKAELEKELQYSKMKEYAALMQRPDFAEKSQYIPTGTGNAIKDNATGQYVDTGFKDIEYDYINKNEKAQTYQGTIDNWSNLNRMGLDRSWLLQMTDEEVAVYNYLYRTQGKDAASEYLDVMRSTLNQRQRAAEEAEWAGKAKEHPFLTSGLSIALAPVKAFGLMGQMADYAADGKIDQNAAYNRASYVSTAIRNQVTEQIRQNEKWGELGAFGYQTAMSMGDFLINGAAGGAFWGVPGVTTAIMGSGAAADTVIKSKDKGLADGESFGLGIVAGLAEALTERFSIEKLLDADLLKNGIGIYVLKNSMTEGSEEVASSIVNLAADILICKEKSEWQEAIRGYQDQGYSEGEAFAKAVADQAESMGMDFLGGALSGGVMSGANSAGYYLDTRRTGQAMGRRGLTDTQQVQQILDAGANAQEGSAANAVAGQLQKKVDAGQQLSQYEKGRLYQSNPQAVGEAVFGQGHVSLATPFTEGISNQDERWQEAQRLASITGRDIKFYNGAENENGYYDPKSGEIYVNTNAADTVAQVVSHELTHSTELAESYADLARYVRGKVRAEGKNWDRMKQEKADFYAAQGHALEKDSDIEAEIVAEYVQKNLLTNEQEIYAAVWESTTLGQKILNWIDGILAKLNNQKAKERQMLHNARQIYARALEESRNKRTGTTSRNQSATRSKTEQNQYAPDDMAYMDEMYREQYNRGELTEEEYDEYLSWREHEAAAEEGAEELGRQYSFAGEKAKTANIQKLHQAKALQAEGVDNETIRQQTGWFQGMDKKWRVEIDDSDFRIDRHGDARGAVSYKWAIEDLESAREELFGSADMATLEEVRAYNRACIAEDTAEMDRLYEKLIHGRHAYWFGIYADAKNRVKEMSREYGGVLHSGNQLADYVQHDALFEAYPQLQEANFRFGWLPDGTRGQYDPGSNTITINDEIADAPERTILHEIQHAIQKAEGFSSGSSPDYWQARQRGGETFGVNDKQIDEEMRHAQSILDSVPEEVAEQFRDWYDLNTQDENAGIIRAAELSDGEYGDQFDDYFMTTWNLEELRKYNYGRGINDLYRNTAGEIEARDTANRWKFGLDEEGRKNTPPDLGDERTVFTEGENWMASLDAEYSDRQNYIDADISPEEVTTGVQEVTTMGPVVQLTGNEFAKGEVDLITQVERFFDEENNEAYNPQLGTVILDRKGIKSDMGHGIGRKKAVAFAAVPAVIEKGRVVNYQKNWKGRGYDTAVIAAPVQIAGEEHIAAVIAIRSRNTNLFYLHEVMTTKDGAMPFKTGARKSGLPSGDAPSIFSILNRLVEVKKNGTFSSEEKQFSLTGAATLNKRDVARDLRAILSRGGDPKELQRYVDSLEQNARKPEQSGKNRYQAEGNRYQTGENRNRTAREILDEAHSQGQSVEEYLRWNPEQFEVDGRWRPEALEAMRMEQSGRKYSLSDSDGRELTKEQQDYFKDSKVRDENGNLKVMYHGSQDAGFHVFDPSMSDDDISLFFVDRNDVAATYSGTYETYEAKAFRSPEDANKFFEQIGKAEYFVDEKDGKYRLREDEGSSYYTIAESESIEDLYQEFCDYEGIGYGDANYKVYLNLKNPLEVDAQGRNWNNISREYSQEVADRYHSLTEEEKAVLADLTEWADYGTFRDHILDEIDYCNLTRETSPLYNAYQKLGGSNSNLYDAFSIAQDNFSEESIQEFAVKQMKTRDYAQKAKAEGYDGVIFKNIVDLGGYSNGSEGASTVAIAFDSNQVKSVANQSPTEDADIRYSLSKDAGEENTESQARVIQRENLPTKAQSYLARAESKLLNSIGDALSVPRYARYNSLKGIIQEISDSYLADGTISDEKMSELFDKAYAEGIVADSAFYDQYKEIKDHLRTYGVTLSDRDKSDIPDFDDFRKRAFGTLRILNEGGVPVDTAYDELHGMAPELFPDSITHPADQLVRMYEVGQSIAVSKKSLDEYYGPERDEFRKWVRNDFNSAVGDAFRDLRQVRRYAEEQATQEDVKKILTVEEAEEAFQELKKLRRNVDKVRAKNLLTESDEILLGRMLKGEIGPQHLNPNEDNVKGITAIYEAKLAYESQVEVLAAYKRSVKAKRLQDADRYLETAGSWKDKRAGILYARETMRRNIMDIVPDKKLAEQIAEHYFEAVHVAEAKSTKFKNDYRDRVRALNLSTKVMKGNLVSEAHAVQLLGEAMDNIRVMENARGRMGMRDGKTLAEWRAVVDDLWMNNTGLDRQKVERAVEEFRKIYDELFQQMNRIRVENGYEPVNYRQGYFPHFQPGGDGIMGFFGKVMGINTQVDALPTTINGLTHTFKPGIQWFGNAQERIGFNTAYDAVEGFDRYIEGVASVIYQTENIQKLRALATQARYRTSDEGIRKQVDFVRMDNRLTEEEKQREINAIYEHGRFALSNFVAELDEYTNLLANKKSKYDRTMESLIGRRAYTLMKAWENRVGANMIAGNLSSALTNFIPLTQAGAQLDSGMILKGMLDTLKNIKQGDGIVGMSDFLTNRRGSDVLVKTWMQKASGVMGTPMELIDNFTSETIVRAAYLQNLKRGLSEAEAMHQADIFASGVMADRSKGAMPTLFESRNPLFKAFTQFQLEVNNQFSEVFKDLPRNHKEKGLATLALILLKYFLGAWMYNELFEKIIGRRSALDPIGILIEAGEDLTGYEIPNLFDMVLDGERIEKKGEGSIGDAGANLVTNILSELPFSAGLTLFGVETDGGRLPASSAVPDLSALWDAATEKELTGEQRWKMIQDELNKLAYVLPPFGGGQISKSWKGIKAYIEGGSYSLDQDGDEILQYPVYKDDPDDAFWSLVRAAFLGKTSLPEAQDWVKNGYNSLNQYETVVYKDLLECGVKDRDAFDIVNQLRAVEDEKTESGEQRAEKRRILAKSGISAEGRATAYYGMVATETEREWMDQLVEAGADQANTMAFVSNLYDADNLKGAEKKQAQYIEFLDAPLTEEEKKVAVGFIMGTALETESGNPSQYAKFLTALETGLTVDKYMEIRATETDIEDYLELADIGIKGDKAADLSVAMATLEPTEGYDNVSWIQRCRTVMEANLTETEKLKALQTVDGMYESTYEKIVTGHNFGMNVKSYIDLKSIMPQFDENGNGSYTQAETEAAINALAGDDNALFALTGTTPNGYTLTDREKAILWQLQNKSWKPYRNPFDREVGQMVYDYLTAEDPAEAAATAESGMAFDITNLFAKLK